MEYLQTFFAQYGALLAQGTWDTIVMSLVSTALAYVIGIPLGVFLVLTDPKKGLLPHKAVNAVLGWIVNIGRSIPFIILLVAWLWALRWAFLVRWYHWLWRLRLSLAVWSSRA